MSKASTLTTTETEARSPAPAWSEAEAHLARAAGQGPALQAMLRLVQDVQRSRLAAGLHAWIAHDDLCVGQQPAALALDLPHLRISPRPDGRLDFRYVDTTPLRREWRVTVEAELAFERLALFLERLHWVG
jgi:hypothetical protein